MGSVKAWDIAYVFSFKAKYILALAN